MPAGPHARLRLDGVRETGPLQRGLRTRRPHADDGRDGRDRDRRAFGVPFSSSPPNAATATTTPATSRRTAPPTAASVRRSRHGGGQNRRSLGTAAQATGMGGTHGSPHAPSFLRSGEASSLVPLGQASCPSAAKRATPRQGGLVRTRCADGERRRTWATPRIRSSSFCVSESARTLGQRPRRIPPIDLHGSDIERAQCEHGPQAVFRRRCARRAPCAGRSPARARRAADARDLAVRGQAGARRGGRAGKATQSARSGSTVAGSPRWEPGHSACSNGTGRSSRWPWPPTRRSRRAAAPARLADLRRGQNVTVVRDGDAAASFVVQPALAVPRELTPISSSGRR